MTPDWQSDDGAVRLYCGDCLDVLPNIDPVETCICDPPYGLSFMGKAWDHGVPGEAYWRAVMGAVLPGAMLLAFGGTRTAHRLTCAIEDAGWEIRDGMGYLYGPVLWGFGSGFPKSQDISKAIDEKAFQDWMADHPSAQANVKAATTDKKRERLEKAFRKMAGAEREVVGANPNCRPNGKGQRSRTLSAPRTVQPNTAPATDAAREWDGWGTALKPAHEIVVCGTSPLNLQAVCGIMALKIVDALCQLRSFVKDAGSHSTLSPSGCDVVELDSALWSAVEKCSTPDALCEVMATWPSESAIPTCLNIVRSWLGILDGICRHERTFTTETATGLITDLTTLNSCPSAFTPESIIRVATGEHGIGSSAWLAASCFIAVATKLDYTLGCSVRETATSGAPEKCRDGLGQDLHPNFEPITLAMAPLDGTFAANALEHGVAGLWIDGARVGTQDNLNGGAYSDNKSDAKQNDGGWGRLHAGVPGKDYVQPAGRWPANLMHDGSEEVLAEFAKAGESSGGPSYVQPRATTGDGPSTFTGKGHVPFHIGDTGSAARFFYCAKASRAERELGLDKCESIMLEWWHELKGDSQWEDADLKVRLLVDTAISTPRVIAVCGVPNNDATAWNTLLFGNNGTDQFQRDFAYTIATRTQSTIDSKTLNWFRTLPISEYTADVNGAETFGGSPAENAELGTLCLTTTSAQIASLLGVGSVVSPMRLRISASAVRGSHPTVKPLALMQYLCRLTRTPKGGTVIDPFMGSGSTGVAAIREGRGFVGIEKEPDLFQIAVMRIKHAFASRGFGIE